MPNLVSTSIFCCLAKKNDRAPFRNLEKLPFFQLLGLHHQGCVKQKLFIVTNLELFQDSLPHWCRIQVAEPSTVHLSIQYPHDGSFLNNHTKQKMRKPQRLIGWKSCPSFSGRCFPRFDDSPTCLVQLLFHGAPVTTLATQRTCRY